jgi:hypothetical protein
MDQATAESNALQNEGQTIYNQQMAQSQAATVAGDQLKQQADVANQNANAETAKASTEANVMNTTGSSGTLYQQNLTAQNTIFGYNPTTLQQTVQLQNQSEGLEKTALNQLELGMGGTRGLSAAGVEAKARSITTQANAFQTQLGKTIQTQEGYAATAETEASNESNAEYTSEQLDAQTYSDNAAAYISEAKNYTTAATAEYNSSTNYVFAAATNLYNFSVAALNTMLTGLDETYASIDTALTKLANSNAQNLQAETTFTNQEVAFNTQQDAQQVSAQKQANSNYEMFIKAGVSGSEAQKLAASYV